MVSLKRHLARILTIGFLIFTVAVAPTRTASTPAADTVIGTNLHRVIDWGTAWPFVDIFKIARPWFSNRAGAPFGQGGPLNLTPQGWVASLNPGQWADTIMFSSSAFYPAGQYVLLYDGEGTIQFLSNSATITSQSPGRMVLNVTPRVGGIELRLAATNPANPVRNIRLIMPGFEGTYQTQPFHPLFLERLARFKAIRFIDWMRTNGSPVVNWADRATLDSATQATDRGVALEYMIQLANTLQANPWFNMPHAASDDYVRRFATMVRDQLNPSLRVYIEYSNETWNVQFGQAAYVQQRGMELGLAGDSFTAGLRYHARRAVEIFTIWEQVFGGRNRLVRVLASQSVNPATGQQVMDWQNAYQHADALAIAPYFGGRQGAPENVASTLRMTVDQVLDVALASIRDNNPNGVRWQMTQNRANAISRGLDLIAYEGGQHLVGFNGAENNEQLAALFIAANRHPRMRQLYLEYLNQWRMIGGGLFNHWNEVSGYSRFGSWGALEYQNQDPTTAPKYQALMEFIGLN